MRVLAFLFLFLFSFHLHAFGENCAYLFIEQSHFEENIYNEALPLEEYLNEAEIKNEAKTLLQEYKAKLALTREAKDSQRIVIPVHIDKRARAPRDTTAEANALREAVQLQDKVHSALRIIFKSFNDAGEFRLDFSKFSREDRERLDMLGLGIISRTSKYLKALGVRHEIVYEKPEGINDIKSHIFISEEGNHYFNKKSREIIRKYNLFVTLSALDLWTWGAVGLHGASGFDGHPIIILRPDILFERSILRDAVFRHEYTHFLDYYDQRSSRIKPYQARIYINKRTPEIEQLASGYKYGFSVDEVRAYQTTIRTLIFEALILYKKIPQQNEQKELKSDEAEKFEDKYAEVVFQIKRVFGFLKIAKRVYSELDAQYDQLKGNGHAINNSRIPLKISDDEVYEISQPVAWRLLDFAGQDLLKLSIKETKDYIEINHKLFSELDAVPNYRGYNVPHKDLENTLREILKSLNDPIINPRRITQ